MLHFTNENIKWLQLLVNDAKSKTTDNNKAKKLMELSDKVTKLGEYSLSITITKEDIDNTNNLLNELEDITKRYTNMSDIGSTDGYDSLKKEIASKLQYLSTYKDIFLNEASYIEDMLKKEIRVTLVEEIKLTEKCSFTQANNLVDKDKRYTTLRDQVYFVKKVATRVKTKYQFYMQLWQMVFQSLSTAAKERYSAKNNNDT